MRAYDREKQINSISPRSSRSYSGINSVKSWSKVRASLMRFTRIDQVLEFLDGLRGTKDNLETWVEVIDTGVLPETFMAEATGKVDELDGAVAGSELQITRLLEAEAAKYYSYTAKGFWEKLRFAVNIISTAVGLYKHPVSTIISIIGFKAVFVMLDRAIEDYDMYLKDIREIRRELNDHLAEIIRLDIDSDRVQAAKEANAIRSTIRELDKVLTRLKKESGHGFGENSPLEDDIMLAIQDVQDYTSDYRKKWNLLYLPDPEEFQSKFLSRIDEVEETIETYIKAGKEVMDNPPDDYLEPTVAQYVA